MPEDNLLIIPRPRKHFRVKDVFPVRESNPGPGSELWSTFGYVLKLVDHTDWTCHHCLKLKYKTPSSEYYNTIPQWHICLTYVKYLLPAVLCSLTMALFHFSCIPVRKKERNDFIQLSVQYIEFKVNMIYLLYWQNTQQHYSFPEKSMMIVGDNFFSFAHGAQI